MNDFVFGPHVQAEIVHRNTECQKAHRRDWFLFGVVVW